MAFGFPEILRIGFADGLVWYPFVLGIGLLFSYFKEIDISIDGVAILSSIACAVVWRQTGSYFLSVLAGILIGLCCSSIVCIFQVLLKISGLMAGIIFSLVAHSLSVIWIGESLVLPETRLITGFGEVRAWQFVLVIILMAITIIFYKTHLGVAARKIGDGCTVNTVYPEWFLKWCGFALSGCLYGLGGAMYAHSQGLAKSGGSFDFLLVSLAAYLCTVRIADFSNLAFRYSGLASIVFREKINDVGMILLEVFTSPALKALIGAILFETLLFFTIANSPNPMYWKFIFALLLFFALSKPETWSFKRSKHQQEFLTEKNITIKNLNVHYDIGSERRDVFKNAEIKFFRGINLIHGANGTGKSTLLKSIAGVVKPSTGQLYFYQKELFSIHSYKRPCFFLQQNPINTLSQELSVAENLFVALSKTAPQELGFNKKIVIDKLMEKLDLLNVPPIRHKNDIFWRKPVSMLSGGEAHCVSFYCGLLSESPILLADEPTNGLDKKNFEQLVIILKALAKSRIILLTSHDSRLSPIADRFYQIGNGIITDTTTTP